MKSKTKKVSEQPKPTFVKRVIVKKLFGHYDYDLRMEGSGDRRTSPFAILYGENGSGKTTILKLLFFLLSHSPNKGHKTALARIGFESVEIELDNGLVISARRKPGTSVGDYAVVCTGDNINTHVNFNYDARADTAKSKPDSALTAILKHLESLNINTLFLTDDRRRISGEEKFEETTDDSESQLRIFSAGRLEYLNEPARRWPLAGLNNAFSDVLDWARKEALTNVAGGEENVNTIYETLVKRLSTTSSQRGGSSDAEIQELLDSFTELSKLTEVFSALGLMAKVNAEPIVSAVTMASGSNKAMMTKILKPYIESVEARTTAVSNLYSVLSGFIGSINNFLRDKGVRFDLTKGLVVVGRSGEIMSPSMLSSGEQQLLLLFCRALTARETSNIIFIDEPEISLNVTWQRMLLDSLLSFSRRGNVQFIIATHSIEILSKHRESVVELSLN